MGKLEWDFFFGTEEVEFIAVNAIVNNNSNNNIKVKN